MSARRRVRAETAPRRARDDRLGAAITARGGDGAGVARARLIKSLRHASSAVRAAERMPANSTGVTAPPIFKREALADGDLAEFKAKLDADGFVFFDSLLTEEA